MSALVEGAHIRREVNGERSKVVHTGCAFGRLTTYLNASER
jgi:hypothetical protein